MYSCVNLQKAILNRAINKVDAVAWVQLTERAPSCGKHWDTAERKASALHTGYCLYALKHLTVVKNKYYVTSMLHNETNRLFLYAVIIASETTN